MLQLTFGTRIKELRQAKLMSQDELAERSGIDRTQISKIEKGKVNATLETIEKLSNALDVTIKELMDIDSSTPAHPFVKWAGGKTQIINRLKEFMPKQFGRYYEPFVGGGAFLFSIAPEHSFISDQNYELICAYKCFQNETMFERLIMKLKEHELNHSEDYYLEVRSWDREENFTLRDEVEHAARFIYLNKACFNGLYRVNSKGYFNVPSAKKSTVKAFDEENFKALRNYLGRKDVQVFNQDYSKTVKSAAKGDFVYFDPPYDVFPDKNGFVDYGKEGFGKSEQIRLRDCFKELADKGVYVMLSNHNTPFINELYDGFNIHVIDAKRMINSDPNGRGNVQEVIITNY
ncbi:MAG: Dam family site-specific DNA-(adenine-N6)-methyltransferase [Bacilli bacterium]|nr:Dam family site-specific DNA-(adenine-N6)-methyltransferase [Bacilli bacterium]